MQIVEIGGVPMVALNANDMFAVRYALAQVCDYMEKEGFHYELNPKGKRFAERHSVEDTLCDLTYNMERLALKEDEDLEIFELEGGQK